MFFPLRSSLRLDAHNFSPAILGKIVGAAARSTSFAAAAESFADEAEFDVSGRQAGRIAHEVGAQLRHVRDRRVEEFQNQQATPEAAVVPRLAVVAVDGDRLHTGSEEPGQGPGVHDPAWREDKVANFLTMSTPSHADDPHPELPRWFTHKTSVVEPVQGIAERGTLADVIESGGEEPSALTVVAPVEEEPEPPWPPEPLVPTWQATLGSSEEFGPIVAAEAQRRNFWATQARVFLGDGGAWIWTLHRTIFPTFEPIVDFVPAFTHVSLAAKAVGGATAAVWERSLDWATACRQGRVATVLEQLGALLEAMPPPKNQEEVQPTDPCEVIRQTIVFRTNNASRMDDPRSRRAG